MTTPTSASDELSLVQAFKNVPSGPVSSQAVAEVLTSRMDAGQLASTAGAPGVLPLCVAIMRPAATGDAPSGVDSSGVAALVEVLDAMEADAPGLRTIMLAGVSGSGKSVTTSLLMQMYGVSPCPWVSDLICAGMPANPSSTRAVILYTLYPEEGVTSAEIVTTDIVRCAPVLLAPGEHMFHLLEAVVRLARGGVEWAYDAGFGVQTVDVSAYAKIPGVAEALTEWFYSYSQGSLIRAGLAPGAQRASADANTEVDVQTLRLATALKCLDFIKGRTLWTTDQYGNARTLKAMTSRCITAYESVLRLVGIATTPVGAVASLRILDTQGTERGTELTHFLTNITNDYTQGLFREKTASVVNAALTKAGLKVDLSSGGSGADVFTKVKNFETGRADGKGDLLFFSHAHDIGSYNKASISDGQLTSFQSGPNAKFAGHERLKAISAAVECSSLVFVRMYRADGPINLTTQVKATSLNYVVSAFRKLPYERLVIGVTAALFAQVVPEQDGSVWLQANTLFGFDKVVLDAYALAIEAAIVAATIVASVPPPLAVASLPVVPLPVVKDMAPPLMVATPLPNILARKLVIMNPAPPVQLLPTRRTQGGPFSMSAMAAKYAPSVDPKTKEVKTYDLSQLPFGQLTTLEIAEAKISAVALSSVITWSEVAVLAEAVRGDLDARPAPPMCMSRFPVTTGKVEVMEPGAYEVGFSPVEESHLLAWLADPSEGFNNRTTDVLMVRRHASSQALVVRVELGGVKFVTCTFFGLQRDEVHLMLKTQYMVEYAWRFRRAERDTLAVTRESLYQSLITRPTQMVRPVAPASRQVSTFDDSVREVFERIKWASHYGLPLSDAALVKVRLVAGFRGAAQMGMALSPDQTDQMGNIITRWDASPREMWAAVHSWLGVMPGDQLLRGREPPNHDVSQKDNPLTHMAVAQMVSSWISSTDPPIDLWFNYSTEPTALSAIQRLLR